jgi:mono/diheme cytochrome c family protein
MRSYLDANCAQCHRPNGVAGYFDARFNTPLATQRLVNGPLANSLGDPSNRVIKPRDLAKSVLYTRMTHVGDLQMPPIARNVINSNAVTTLAEWIDSLPRTTEPPAPKYRPALRTFSK